MRGVHGDVGYASQVVARISKCARRGMHWHALEPDNCALIAPSYSLRSVHNFVITIRGTLDKFSERFKILARTLQVGR